MSLISTAFADVNTPDTNDSNLPAEGSKEKNAQLIKAVEDGNLAAVQAAIAQGGDVNFAFSKDDQTPLMVASSRGYTEIVKLLLANKVYVNISHVNNGLTPLLLASGNGHTEVVKLLLAAKADVNSAVKGGQYPVATSLWVATMYGYPDVVKLLLDAKADANVKVKYNGNEVTPLKLAKSLRMLVNMKSIIKILEDYGATE